jgi:L-fucose isomerase-like protein
MKKRFGVTVVKKSFKKFGADAKGIPDSEAEEALQNWNIPTKDISNQMLNSAVKIYIAVKREVEKDENIRGVGINCLNESFHSDTTPCLAWNMLFEDKGILWACEADIMVLLTKYMIYRSLQVPIMMSNIYPVLMGQAALKHERIPNFPEVEGDPADYSLIAHCGYLGVLPQSFATEWVLRPKVLAIVDDNATAIDARMPEGDLTIAKLDPTMQKLLMVEGSIAGYAQYPGSDCRNGAVIRVPNGNGLLDKLYSHHILLMSGHMGVELANMATALGLEIDVV